MAQTTSKKCDLCIENEAALFCYECKNALCVTCRMIHDRMAVTKHHKVAGLDKVDRLVYQCKALCETHREVLSFNCISCFCLICNSCLTSDHKDHSICSIVELSAKTRATVKENVTIMKTTCQEITDVLEKVKIVHNQKVLNPTRQEISEIQKIGTFLRGVVDDIENTRKSEVEAFKEFESDQLGMAIKRLEALHKEYIASCNIFERMLEETHEITFLQIFNMHKRSFTQLEDIPMLCEPDERKAFEPESFFYDMMCRVNTVECFSESVKAVARKIVENEYLEKEDRIAHLELKLEETRTELGSKLRQISDHQDQINHLRVELASVREQENSAIKEIDRLEQSIQELQLNLASSHQRHKSDTNKMSEQLSTLESALHQKQARGQALEQELNRREDQLKQNETDIKSCRDDIVAKIDEMNIPILKDHVREHLQSFISNGKNFKNKDDRQKAEDIYKRMLEGEKKLKATAAEFKSPPKTPFKEFNLEYFTRRTNDNALSSVIKARFVQDPVAARAAWDYVTLKQSIQLLQILTGEDSKNTTVSGNAKGSRSANRFNKKSEEYNQMHTTQITVGSQSLPTDQKPKGATGQHAIAATMPAIKGGAGQISEDSGGQASGGQ